LGVQVLWQNDADHEVRSRGESRIETHAVGDLHWHYLALLVLQQVARGAAASAPVTPQPDKLPPDQQPFRVQP